MSGITSFLFSVCSDITSSFSPDFLFPGSTPGTAACVQLALTLRVWSGASHPAVCPVHVPQPIAGASGNGRLSGGFFERGPTLLSEQHVFAQAVG